MIKYTIDLAALVMAAIALYYSVDSHKESVQLQIDSEVQKARPLLQVVFLKVDSEKNKGIKVRNIGLGPAIIKSFKYYIGEENYKNGNSHISWVTNQGALTFSKQNEQIDELAVLYDGYVIGNEKDDKVFLIRETVPEFYSSQLRYDMENIIIEIEYTSLNSLDAKTYYLRFNDKFKINNIRSRTAQNIYE